MDPKWDEGYIGNIVDIFDDDAAKDTYRSQQPQCSGFNRRAEALLYDKSLDCYLNTSHFSIMFASLGAACHGLKLLTADVKRHENVQAAQLAVKEN